MLLLFETFDFDIEFDRLYPYPLKLKDWFCPTMMDIVAIFLTGGPSLEKRATFWLGNGMIFDGFMQIVSFWSAESWNFLLMRRACDGESVTPQGELLKETGLWRKPTRAVSGTAPTLTTLVSHTYQWHWPRMITILQWVPEVPAGEKNEETDETFKARLVGFHLPFLLTALSFIHKKNCFK